METASNPIGTEDQTQRYAGAPITLADYIQAQSPDKRVIIFGDTDHRCTEIAETIFSAPVLQALSDKGYRDFYLERPPSDIHKMNALLQGKITPADYALIDRPQYHDHDHIPPYVREMHDQAMAEGLLFAAKIGLRFHLSDMSHGFFKDPTLQKQYLFMHQEKERLWVNFLLKNKDYFTQPEALIDRLIAENKQRYAKKNVDLECIHPRNQRHFSPWRVVYKFWETDNAKLIPDLSKFEKRLRTAFETPLELVQERNKQDAALCASFNKQSKGGKFAVFYGAGHIRNDNGGFMCSLKPEETSICHIFENEAAIKWYWAAMPNIDPSDSVAFLKSKQVAPAAGFVPA